LVALNAGVLLLAVMLVAVVAVRLLGRLADDQALARVAQAGAIARREVDNEHQAVETAAELLAERPTLRALLQRSDRAALTQFVAQFAQTSALDGAAVWRNGELIASSDERLPWAALWAARSQTTPRLVVPADDVNPVIMAAWQSLPNDATAAVLVAQRLDATRTQQIGDRIGAPVEIIARTAPQNGTIAALARLQTQALATGNVATARIDAAHSYMAVAPLQAPDGTAVALLQTSLPTDDVQRGVQQLTGTLVLLAAAVSGIAALGNFLFGRRLARPLVRLTRAAAQIGGGNLQSPIQHSASHEIGTLAATLEDMRRRLLQLTADLRHQQAEAQAILTGINEGVFTVDRERRIRYLNKQAAALLNVDGDAVLGRFCGDVLHPQGPDGVRPCETHCPIVHARFRGGARATEHLLITGQRRTVVITSAPTIDEQQVQVLRDETDIEAVRRVRDTVLANVSHEFRTPLSAQLASIELLLDQLPDLTADQTGDLVRSLQRGTLRLTQLIDNLLESARLEAGYLTIRQRPVALDAVVEDALELMRPLFDQRAQQVAVDLPYPLPSVCGDPPRLTQVFVNLLANANKFSPAHSTIQIGGTVGTSSVTLWVEDEGPGLPGGNGPTLFGQFVRAHANEPEQGGVGLGLWIVQSIVERHGGTVDARSVARGTRMCVTLPMEYT
jgi:signal transduction histidine kinase